ncbi:hypothetical protein CSKR_102074 [Clonorchis sinensis]|uniref:Claudin-like protein septate junction protein n=2 Tax=Clonorchis sinensis TaxID=79923 RepID=A0A3R7C4W0_CLOSI|nr:hypothetical protein CSKR_102074 [Clonorchis sinensis]
MIHSMYSLFNLTPEDCGSGRPGDVCSVQMQPFKEKSHRLFLVFLWTTIAAVTTNFISFVSPFWIQSVPEAHSQFERIGLWTACFNGYMRPDDFSKAYFGCYYIYFVEYDRIRQWINPLWLYAIQVLSSLGILLQSLVTFTVLCQVTHSVNRDDLSVVKFNLLGHFFTCVTLAASLVAFAIARYDSTWMPYPSLNVLSWAYATAVLSFVLTLVAFIAGFLRYMYLDAMAQFEVNQALLENQDEMGISSPPLKTGLSPSERLDNELYSDEMDRDDVEEQLDEDASGRPASEHTRWSRYTPGGYDQHNPTHVASTPSYLNT